MMGTTGRVLRKVRAQLISEPTGFGWVEKGKLAGSGLPSSRSQVAWLSRAGAKTLLTLTESPLPASWLEGTGLRYRHIPMVDHEPPEKGRLVEAVTFVDDEIMAGRAVVVHCLAGKGRTGCVLAGYLMLKGMPLEDAVEFVRRQRPGSVERSQEQALRNLQEMLKGASSGSRA
jgi:atypical dual specificity phosphatase